MCKKPAFFLFFILSLLPVTGSGFDVPCLQWFSEPQTTALVPPAFLPEQETQVEVILPVTKDEFLDVYGHQIGALLISLLPMLDLYIGTGSHSQARLFALYFYSGLYLENLFQLTTYFPRVAFDFMLENMDQEFLSPGQPAFWQKPGLSTDIPLHSHSTDRPLKTSLYIRTESDRDVFFSEADQMIDYSSQLFELALDSEHVVYSPDNLAFATPPESFGEYDVYQLSVTNPDNATHTYDIAHREGCNWLLVRDGMAMGDELAASWPQGSNTVLSLSPVNSPLPLIRRKLKLHIPRAFIGLGMSRVASLTTPVQQQLLGGLLSSLSKVVISAGSFEVKSFDLVPVTPQDEVLPLRADILAARPVLPVKGVTYIPGMIQLMERPPDERFRLGPPPSGAGGGGHQGGKKQPDRGDEPSKREPGDGDGRGASPDSSTSSLSSLGNGMSLIELVARDRTLRFAGGTAPRSVNVAFIKLLSRAGLAQVVVRDGSDYGKWPLGISKTLLRYLTTYKEKDGMPDRRDSLWAKQDGTSYYLEMDQEIYDVMLERFDEIKALAKQRSDIFAAYRKELLGLIYRLNQIHAGYRFVFIGGEALRAQMAMLQDKGHFMRGNFPIRDDVDVLMRMGNIEMFRTAFTTVNSLLVMPPQALSMSFSFPFQSGMSWFNVYKFQLKSAWGEFLPTLDISFPDERQAMPDFGDNQSVLVESLNRALKFKKDKQKYLDRTLFLRNLLPESLGAEYLYLREFILPPLIADRERLLAESMLSQEQRKELEVRVQQQQDKLEERFKEMEELRRGSKETRDEIRLELEKDVSSKLEARMEKLIIKSKAQTEAYSAQVLKLQEQKKEISGQLKTKERLVLGLMADLKISNSELEQAQNKFKSVLERQAELEESLQKQEAEPKADPFAQKHSEEVTALESEKAELQAELKSLKESNSKKITRVSNLKATIQDAQKKYNEKKTEIEQLKQEQKRRKGEYSLLETQLVDSKGRIALLERELAELQKQAELLKANEAAYEQNKKEINREFGQMEERLQQAERDNLRLREEVRWYWNDRNLRVAIGMIPAGILLMREFLVPRFFDAAKATCSRFKRDIIYQYCVRNWITEEAVLWALEAFDSLPGHTRIVRFTEVEHFEPGYYLAVQTRVNKVELNNYLLRIKEMHLHLPDDFMSLKNLYPSELDQSLKAFFPALAHRKSPAEVKRFAKANLLLCGIMPEPKQQHDCAVALSTEMGVAERWPCHMHNFTNDEDNLCERMLLSGFTQKLTNKKLLALMPSWFVKSDGGMEWYDTWPVQMNRHHINKELPGGSCSQFMVMTKYCAGERMRIWQFTDNHWDLKSHLCSSVSPIDIGMPKAFWLQSRKGDINDVMACDGMKFMRTVWHP